MIASDNDFDIFRSNVCHELKSLGDIEFVNQLILRKDIERFFLKGEYVKSFYLLALIDYLCRVNNLAQPVQYNDMRNLKLSEPICPRDMLFLNVFSDDFCLKDVFEKSIPEFKKFNIIEIDIRDVV